MAETDSPCRCKIQHHHKLPQSDRRHTPPADREGSSGHRRSVRRQSSQNAAGEVRRYTGENSNGAFGEKHSAGDSTWRHAGNSAVTAHSDAARDRPIIPGRDDPAACRGCAIAPAFAKASAHSTSSDRVCMCFRMIRPATHRVGRPVGPGLACPRSQSADRESPNRSIDLAGQPHQWMAQVNDLFQRRP
jgi:hypothetical protein